MAEIATALTEFVNFHKKFFDILLRVISFYDLLIIFILVNCCKLIILYLETS